MKVIRKMLERDGRVNMRAGCRDMLERACCSEREGDAGAERLMGDSGGPSWSFLHLKGPGTCWKSWRGGRAAGAASKGSFWTCSARRAARGRARQS